MMLFERSSKRPTPDNKRPTKIPYHIESGTDHIIIHHLCQQKSFSLTLTADAERGLGMDGWFVCTYSYLLMCSYIGYI